MKIKLKGRGIIRVTKAHSLFVFRDGKIVVEPAYKIKPGDYIVVAEKIPMKTSILENHNNYIVINIAETILNNKKPYSKRYKLENSLWIGFDNGIEKRVTETTREELDKALYVRLSRSKNKVFNKVIIDEEIAWTIGLFTAEGSLYRGRYISFNLGPHEEDKARSLISIIKRKFGITPKLVKNTKEVRVIISSRIIHMLFQSLGVTGTARTKRIPDVIINSPPTVILSYIKGLIDGDGSIDKYGDIIYVTRSKILSKQLFLILQMLGLNPSILINKDDIVIRIGKSVFRTPSNIYMYLTGRNSSNLIPTEPTYGIPINDEIKKQLIALMNAGITSYSSKNTNVSKGKLLLLSTQRLIQLPLGYKILINGDATLAKVLTIEEEEYEGYVYDFAVPITNSFIGGYGIVYHNSDPYGWYIYSVFKIGSITLSYESERLATPNAKFIGVMMTDVFNPEIINDKLSKIKIKDIEEITPKKLKSLPMKKPYLSEKERRNFIIKAKPKDVERAVELIGYEVADICLDNKEMRDRIRRRKEGLAGYPWFRTPLWIRELCIFFKTLSKLEIEAMASKGLKFLADEYIPKKIETGDWID